MKLNQHLTKRLNLDAPETAPPAASAVYIVPALPPAVNGLGDYAAGLAEALRGRR